MKGSVKSGDLVKKKWSKDIEKRFNITLADHDLCWGMVIEIVSAGALPHLVKVMWSDGNFYVWPYDQLDRL